MAFIFAAFILPILTPCVISVDILDFVLVFLCLLSARSEHTPVLFVLIIFVFDKLLLCWALAAE